MERQPLKCPWPGIGLAGLALVASAALVPALAGDRASAESAPDAADGYVAEIEAWRERRVDRLTAEEGWVTLAGLAWLVDGANRLGSAPDSEVPLPAGKAPALAGTIHYAEGAARLEAAPGAGITHEGEPVSSLALVSDQEKGTTVLELGDLVFYPIRRGVRLGIRVKDRQHPLRFSLPGIESYPVDPAWRIEARFEPHAPGTTIPVPNILGTIDDSPTWGAVVFEVGGETYRLDALAEPGDEELFLIFADETTGETTYGGGRYLYADAPDAAAAGDPATRVVVDFNKAYNPPCVFTPYATCPLPPRGNRLPIRIEAGEKATGLEDLVH